MLRKELIVDPTGDSLRIATMKISRARKKYGKVIISHLGFIRTNPVMADIEVGNILGEMTNKDILYVSAAEETPLMRVIYGHGFVSGTIIFEKISEIEPKSADMIEVRKASSITEKTSISSLRTQSPLTSVAKSKLYGGRSAPIFFDYASTP